MAWRGGSEVVPEQPGPRPAEVRQQERTQPQGNDLLSQVYWLNVILNTFKKFNWEEQDEEDEMYIANVWVKLKFEKSFPAQMLIKAESVEGGKNNDQINPSFKGITVNWVTESQHREGSISPLVFHLTCF